ncbi:MAG: hypothetical protein ACLTG0_10015 [Oscillibacter sp.]
MRTARTAPRSTSSNCCEGLEGAELNVCSGDVTINASDDCLNAANSDLTDYDFTMTISGGAIDTYTSAETALTPTAT